ncbi:anthranilate synthase family protein [Solwaraspora sp. WMMD406]|uniref:anthranilate synthase family protein n=1 Tax=Solwaraspora sp. WMMD406 TaxID=3016095 RepID=UPI0024175EA6|nr:anthranilate synthase family protein [Solwaraspora sp. WMMD406]MDG4765682.1 anthranilate synthase family protein [Solwaraspora sp. WMMD406]
MTSPPTSLADVLASVDAAVDPGPFALLHRADQGQAELLTGVRQQVDRLADVPLPTGPHPATATLAVVPYRQIGERGFAHVDDGAPLECLLVEGYRRLPMADLVAALPTAAPATVAAGFDIADDAYADLVRRVLREEIGAGAGANFVLRRVFQARLADDGRRDDDYGADADGRAEAGRLRSAALTAGLCALRRLLRDEHGAYWTFLVYTGTRILVGATPERHVSVTDGLAMMNPISGTLRHPDGPPDAETLRAFLDDPKEVDELYMVLDEELKMMATVAEHGGQVIGPYLKRMSRLTHTEYLLAGRNCHDVREVLRQTMFAPTVTGSPIENACRVIARYEPQGRRYYAGVLALLGHDRHGQQTLDAPILIRAAEISLDGRIAVPVGATLVRHSSPAGEVAETYAKAAAVLTALGLAPGPRAADTARHSTITAVGDAATTGVVELDHPAVRRALAARNDRLARFWLDQRAPGALTRPALADRRIVMVDGEDSFTGMLTHLLRALGVEVVVVPWTEAGALDLAAGELVLVGPGPGDPRDPTEARIRELGRLVERALRHRHPLLGVCLGHQLLADRLGLPVRRRPMPYQGLQREIDFFGTPRRVGFYASFTAFADADTVPTPYGRTRCSRDGADGAVHALRSDRFAGVQFHPESVLSPDGSIILGDLLTGLLTETPAPEVGGVPYA